MKRFMICNLQFAIVVFALSVLFGTPVAAITYVGPACSELYRGQSSIAFEWSGAEIDIPVSVFGFTDQIPDVETNLFMGRFAFSPADRAEFFARLGLGEIERMGEEFAWGVGAKIRTDQLGDLSSGLAVQITNLRGDETVVSGPYLINGQMDLYAIQFTPGIVWEIGSVSLYGGPLLQIFTGEIDIEGIIIDIDEELQIGGYGGLSLRVAENCFVNGEFQATSDSWAAGVNVQLRFGKTNASSITRSRPREPALPIFERPSTAAPPRGPKERLKVDERGEPVRDEKGNFIFEPVPE